MQTDFEIKGLKELEAQLLALGPKIAKNSMRRAIGRGAAVFRKAMKESAPRRQSAEPKLRTFPPLAKNITSSTRFDRKLNEVTGKAGPSKKVSPVARWYEFGTSKQQPRPWLRPIARAKAPEALQVIADYLRSDIPNLITKHNAGR